MLAIIRQILSNRLQVFSQVSLEESFLLISRRLLNRSSLNDRPYDEFVCADTIKFILNQGGQCRKKQRLNEITFFQESFQKTLTFSLRRKTTDFHVFNQIFRSCEYLPLHDLVAHSKLSGSLNIIDAGANVGCSAVWLAYSFPNSKVFALEIDNSNFSQMVENIKLNILEDRIFPLHFALWHNSDVLVISDQFRDGREYAFSVKPFDSREVALTTLPIKQVNSLTPYDLRKQYGLEKIDILKMDIEGAEKYLLEELDQAAETLNSVRILALEIHDDAVSRELIELNLTRLGFEWFNQNETLFAVQSSI